MLRYFITGESWLIATVSIVIKTFVLYLIMITGVIWEKVVYGRYLFAPAFFWEDMVSMVVMALHTAYVINAAQFLLQLHAARLGAGLTLPDPSPDSHPPASLAQR